MTTFLKTVGLAVAATLGLLAADPAPAQTNDDYGQDAPTPRRGGTLRLVAGAATSNTLDPQINYTSQYFQLNYILYDGLMTFRKADGVAGDEVVPDLAESWPRISDGGKTLIFTLRDGVRFSDGRPVTVEDVAASFRRMFKVRGPIAASFFETLVGADACIAKPESCTLDGGVTVDPATRRITLRLTEPDSELPQKLSLPLAAILPADAPPHDAGNTPIPGTGPYMIKSSDPGRSLQLVRNPSFKEFSADAQPDGWVDAISYEFGLDEDEQIAAVGSGRADWMFDTIPPERLQELAIKYARRIHVRPRPTLWYAAMNINQPPFNDLRVRQAVNFAIDRYALVKRIGGVNYAAVTCQILPPGLPSYKPYCPYTLNPGVKWFRPDLQRARDLVAASGTGGMKISIVVKDSTIQRAVGEALADTLNAIGYSASVRTIAKDRQFGFIQNTDNKVQISVTVWNQDYPAASDFLYILFSCTSFHPSSDASINISGFCDRDIEAKMNEALRLGVTDQAGAAAAWAQIDRAITDQAPIAPLFTVKDINFLSVRVRNFEFNDQIHWILSKAWIE